MKRLVSKLIVLLMFVFFLCTSNVFANIVSPSPGTILNSSTTTFIWEKNLNAQCYWLFVGTTLGGSHLYSGGGTSNFTYATVVNLPIDGSKIYIRLWMLINGFWRYADYIYNTASKAEILAPTPGTTLSSNEMVFSWNNTGASYYWLSIGLTKGSSQLFSNGGPALTTAFVNNLPSDGSIIYVRLWAFLAGYWRYNDYYYHTASKAEIISPLPGTTLNSEDIEFVWENTGASNYWIFVGSTQGGYQLYSSGGASFTSAFVTNLPSDGSVIYVRLWSLINGNWMFNDYNFTAFSTIQSGLFVDVAYDHWANEAIEELYHKGIISDDTEGYFHPGEFLTRAESVVFIIKALNGVSFNPPPPVGVFNDVPAASWCAAYIEEAYRLGLINGYSNSYFYPNNLTSRYEVIVVMERIISWYGANSSSWFEGYVADSNNYSSGVTRAEMANLLFETLFN